MLRETLMPPDSWPGRQCQGCEVETKVQRQVATCLGLQNVGLLSKIDRLARSQDAELEGFQDFAKASILFSVGNRR